MKRNSGTAAERPVLALAADACSAPEPEGAEQAELTAELVPMSAAERVRLRYRGAAASAREFGLSVERFLDAQAHPKPETMREHWAHVQSRPWIPEGMPERAERVLALAGILHHVVIAYPWKALMKSVRFAAEKGDEAADRISVFYGWAAFSGLLALILFLAHLL